MEHYYLAKVRRDADAKFEQDKRQAVIETTNVTGGSISAYLALVGAVMAAAVLLTLGALVHQTQKMVDQPSRRAYVPLSLASLLMAVCLGGDELSQVLGYVIGATTILLFNRHVLPRRLVEQKLARVMGG